MYITFVQGQFNQGGAGALRFCGQRNLQLVISRRNPELLGPDPDDVDKQWGFTIVRRERASEATDGRKNSIFTYLAPVGVGRAHEPRNGDVLAFSAVTMPLFPNDDEPFGRETTYGTAIKLYEYQYIGERSNIIFGKRVILRRLELLLPEIALPVRLHEFRKNAAGKVLPKGSRETTLVGLRRRLVDNENVEAGFPITPEFLAEGREADCRRVRVQAGRHRARRRGGRGQGPQEARRHQVVSQARRRRVRAQRADAGQPTPRLLQARNAEAEADRRGHAGFRGLRPDESGRPRGSLYALARPPRRYRIQGRAYRFSRSGAEGRRNAQAAPQQAAAGARFRTVEGRPAAQRRAAERSSRARPISLSSCSLASASRLRSTR